MQVAGTFPACQKPGKGLARPEFQGSGRFGGSNSASEVGQEPLCPKKALLGIISLIPGDGTIPSTAGGLDRSRGGDRSRGICCSDPKPVSTQPAPNEQLGAPQLTPMC